MGIKTKLAFKENIKIDFSIFMIFGLIYFAIEVIMRIIDYPVLSGIIDMTVVSRWSLQGYASIWMYFVGGLCGLLIGKINSSITLNKLSYRLQVFIGFAIIMVLEFVSGIIFNKLLGFHLWDYSSWPFNIAGQVCLYAALLWIFMVPMAMWIDDVLRFYIGQQPRPDSLFSYYKKVVSK